jgi:acetolactate synthase-1/2/3 large subunit
VDFCGVAKAMGAHAIRITKKEELEPALLEAMKSDVMTLIDCQIDEDDKVFPMCSPGTPLQDTFDESDLRIKRDE